MDRLQKTVVDRVTQNKQRIQCEVLTESGQTVEDSIGHSDTDKQTVRCEVLTDSGQNVEGSSGHSDTEPTEDTV